jgi:hypothetical protein
MVTGDVMSLTKPPAVPAVATQTGLQAGRRSPPEVPRDTAG